MRFSTKWCPVSAHRLFGSTLHSPYHLWLPLATPADESSSLYPGHSLALPGSQVECRSRPPPTCLVVGELPAEYALPRFYFSPPPVGHTSSLQSLPEHLPVSHWHERNRQFVTHISFPPRAQMGNPISCYSSHTQQWANDALDASV